MKRVLPVVFIVLGASAILYGLASERSGRDSASRKGPVAPSSAVESFMEGIKVINRIDGREQWALSAEKASFSQEATGLQSVTLRLPGEEMTVVSDSGVYSMESGDLRLEGNVKAETKSYAIKTGTLNIFGKGGEVSTGEPVIVESRSFRIEGEGMTVNGDTVRLLKNVRAEFF